MIFDNSCWWHMKIFLLKINSLVLQFTDISAYDDKRIKNYKNEKMKGLFGAKRVSARAGFCNIWIVDLKSGSHQRLDVVDVCALEVFL